MFQNEYPPKPSKLPMHPIWRGIGLIMMVVLPAGSYLLANMLIEKKSLYSWVVIPTDLILNKFPKDPFILVRLFLCRDHITYCRFHSCINYVLNGKIVWSSQV